MGEMGADYYKMLHVGRNASDEDLKTAYRKLAVQWNPDNTTNNRLTAGLKLKQISEAYEVLSDPRKRAIYDQYGEEGLKGQVPPPDAAGPGGATYFSTGGGSTSLGFEPRNADDIFSEFFGFSSPSRGTGGPGGGMRGSQFSSSMFDNDLFGPFRRGDGGGGGSMFQSPLIKAPPIEKKLHCSLEELYKGIAKKMKISRDIADISGKPIVVEEILTVDVKSGWKKGTKITFLEKGNKGPNIIPADLVFIIDEKPHCIFTRDGNDLIVTKPVSLAEAITGTTVNITTLDDRTLNISINNVIHPNYEEFVKGEGMPLPKDPFKKGNLRIKFDVKFPRRLITEQKADVKKLLGG